MIAFAPAQQGVGLAELLSGFADTGYGEQISVHGLSLDSRTVRPGDLFCAIAGHQGHGLQYHQEVIRKGACAILYDPQGGGRELARRCVGVRCIPVETLQQKVGSIADRFFGHPSRDLDVIAVTGTNGKTSCSHFVAQALSGPRPAAVIGTLGWGPPASLRPTQQTTPDAIEVHSILSKLRSNTVGAVAIEASSHGLVQGRLNGVRLKSALYTNITRDHLDYHGTLDAYVEAKMRLLDFAGLESLVLNADDRLTCRAAERAPAGINTIAFSAAGNRHPRVPTLYATGIEQDSQGLTMEVTFDGSVADVRAPVFGDYNAENLLGTLGVLLAMRYGLSEAAERVGKVRPIPGRMEHFSGPDGVTAVVDYAHTPDALNRVLKSLRAHCRGRLWVVFGCGGERDAGKRPMMGQAAERWADSVVLTDDNPRHEDGDAIVADILSGCSGRGITVQRDRRLAIEFAIRQAEPQDIVLVAGKGHESIQDLGSARLPFDDREVVQTLIRARAGAV